MSAPTLLIVGMYLDLFDTVVTGNEGSGIDEDVLDLCDTELLQAMKTVALWWMF